jgi:hypothetical protein
MNGALASVADLARIDALILCRDFRHFGDIVSVCISFLGVIRVVHQFLLARSSTGEGRLPRTSEFRVASNMYFVATSVRVE